VADSKRHDEGEARDKGGARGESREDAPAAGVILVAFEKLFGGGRGVRRFSRSGLRYVKLTEGATLIEQNPKKTSEWAELARRGRRVAWVMRDGEYLARVVDGEVTFLK
jgi:hypothetical protein